MFDRKNYRSIKKANCIVRLLKQKLLRQMEWIKDRFMPVGGKSSG